MIISASRRTDIPAWYPEWFLNRLRAGTVCVRNPMNAHQMSRISLDREVVDCIVFWTKDSEPIFPYLDEIDRMGYKFYFQFTLNPYNNKIETGLGNKQQILESFIKLSQRIGKERVIWRYDPVFVGKNFSVDYHLEAFGRMVGILGEHTERCVFSFVDPYKKNSKDERFSSVSETAMRDIAKGFSVLAKPYGIELQTCAELIDLDDYGISHSSCIDGKLIERITGMKLIRGVRKDSQRAGCLCIECIDIGEYDSCLNGCLYCYATRSLKIAAERHQRHDPGSEILIGSIGDDDKITDRKVRSLLERQIGIQYFK